MDMDTRPEYGPPFTEFDDADQPVGSAYGGSREPRDAWKAAPEASWSRAGLFSQTVITGPAVRWILPARLRNKYQKDVAFVSERCLQIKEVISGIRLENVVARTDFDTNIIAAKAIDVGPELPWDSQMKLEAGDMLTDNDSELFENLPPQILLLSLDSRDLAFLYYSDTVSGRFVHYRRPLPSDVNTFERFGYKIAVDPRSRAVAVSAPCNYFGILMLRKRSELLSQMVQNRLDPISEERFFRVDGDIISMEFLFPTPEDGDRVVLLLLVAHGETTQAVSYDWDAKIPLKLSTPRVVTRTLPSECRLPSIVIPSTKRCSFILVTPTSLILYMNSLSFHTQPIKYPLHIPSNVPQRSPLCTRFARPLRNLLHNQWHDDIYLCFDDGTVTYLEIGKEGDVETQVVLGHLHCDVDTAFDTLDTGHEGADLIAAAGDMNDGGLFIQKARDHPQCVQRFMNWSPVTDSAVVEPLMRSYSAADTSNYRLFACHASSNGQGDLVELRHGIEAQIGLVVPLEDFSSAREIWTMLDDINGGVYILTSDPVSSLLFYLAADFDEEICAVDESDSGLDLSSRTLAADCIPSGALIQVTEKAVHVGVPNKPHARGRFECGSDQSIIAAAIRGSDSLIAAAVRAQHGVHLHIITVPLSDGDYQQSQIRDTGCAVKVDEEPICVTIEVFGPVRLIFVGTGEGSILIYRIDDEMLLLISRTSVAVDGADDISTAIESLAAVNSTAGKPLAMPVLFCGLRSGFIVPFQIEIDENTSTIGMKQASPRRLGQTSVKVQSSGKFALSTCGRGFWKISCLDNSTEYTFERVWVTDQNNPAYFPKVIHCFTISDALGASLKSFFNPMLCATDGQLLICTLGQTAKCVPRKIRLPGSANRVTYSKHLNSLVVGYTCTELDMNSNPIQRLTVPFIEFIDPDSQEPRIEAAGLSRSDSSRPLKPQGAVGERINCILEWMPKKDGKVYHLVVIGTSRKSQRECGRVIFLAVSRNPASSTRVQCTVKGIQKFNGPVHAIAAYGPATLMVSAGNDIIPLEAKWPEAQETRIARYSLQAPAHSITVREPYLYLSTARQSMVILKVADGRLILHAHSNQKLDGLSHVLLDESGYTLTSTRGGRVSILAEGVAATSDKTLPRALAEAHLPVSIMKLIPAPSPSLRSSPPSPLVYGTTITGAVYRFSVLTEKEWHLLRLLQDLCIRDPAICPFMPRRKRRNPMETGPLNLARQMHIDGDILSRLVGRGTSYLEYMVTTADFDDPLLAGEGSSSAVRLERFIEASEQLLGKSPNPAEGVMRWLRRLTHVEL